MMKVSRLLNLLARLLLLCLLATASCATENADSGPGTETAPTPPAQTSSNQPPPPRDGMVQVTAGPFLYGATEEQFQTYFLRSTMNFPGMEQALRKQFIIPTRPDDLPQFYIQQFEVTNWEYKDYVDATGYAPDDPKDYLKVWQRGTYPEWAENFPVVWVSPEDARRYCEWRGGFLPSEEQWEKASRGASGRPFPWGNTFPTPETANFGRDQAEPVGNRAGDVSPYEVFDLAGNVSEWTSSRARIDGQEYLVARGGSFAEPARETISARRRLIGNAPGIPIRQQDIGFRCAAN